MYVYNLIKTTDGKVHRNFKIQNLQSKSEKTRLF